MVPRHRVPGSAPERRFFLERPIETARDAVRLAAGEAEHAQRVLRLEVGDPCLGLDGMGRAWPLEVTASEKRRFEVAVRGEAQVEPMAGSAGAPMPWIEVAVVLPKGARAEEMLDRLVQLGVSAIVPLLADRAGPEARSESANRRERLTRIAHEACKQSGRLWSPVWEASATCAELLIRRSSADGARETSAAKNNADLREQSHAGRRAISVVRLDPRGTSSLSSWLAAAGAPDVRRAWTRERPLTLAIGPEGGFSPEEEALFDAHGAAKVRLAPHVLRIETAAEAALAVIAERCIAQL